MKNQDLKTEQELLKNAQKDSKNFDSLYRYYVDDVYRFSYSILNNRHDAEDITSQTFIEFYKKLQDYKWQNISLKYWFFTTARNLCYTKFRKKPEVEFDEKIHSENFQEVSFVDEIMNKDLIEKVKQEIQKLSPSEQELINLRIWEGMRFNEIADLQEIKLTTCKLKFYRAIQKIKKSLEEKNIMYAISFPFLFTVIRDVGNLEIYHASARLLGIGTSIILGKTAMSTIGNILTNIEAALATKAGTAIAITTTTAVIATSGFVAYQYTYKQNRDPQKQQATLNNFRDEKLGITFDYPSDYEAQINYEDNSITIYGDDSLVDNKGYDDGTKSSLILRKSTQIGTCTETEESGGTKYGPVDFGDSRKVVGYFRGGPGSPLRDFYVYRESGKVDNMGFPTYIVGCYFPILGETDPNIIWNASMQIYPDFDATDLMKVLYSAKVFKTNISTSITTNPTTINLPKNKTIASKTICDSQEVINYNITLPINWIIQTPFTNQDIYKPNTSEPSGSVIVCDVSFNSSLSLEDYAKGNYGQAAQASGNVEFSSLNLNGKTVYLRKYNYKPVHSNQDLQVNEYIFNKNNRNWSFVAEILSNANQQDKDLLFTSMEEIVGNF